MTSFQLALSNLTHDRTRTAVSITGAAFAVVLIFMQLGFLGAVETTATLLYDRLEFDILITSGEYLDLTRPGRFHRERLAQAEAAAGVREVNAISVSPAMWKNPTQDPIRGGKRWQITIIGLDPGRMDRMFRPTESGLFRDQHDFANNRPELDRMGVVLLDRRSRRDFGKVYDPDEPHEPGTMRPGLVTELNGQQVELGGYFELGTGFSFAGLLLANEETYSDVTGLPSDQVTFGLVRISPGADPNVVAQEVKKHLPSDVLVYTRGEIESAEKEFWVSNTAAGQFFTFGAILAFVVGAIFVYQMMVADIKKHLPEYATLKAVGYPFRYLFMVVVWQSMILAIAGYALGLLASIFLYDLTRKQAQFPIEMTIDRLALVLAMSVGMCVGSGLLAVRKVRTADPADLF